MIKKHFHILLALFLLLAVGENAVHKYGGKVFKYAETGIEMEDESGDNADEEDDRVCFKKVLEKSDQFTEFSDFHNASVFVNAVFQNQIVTAQHFIACMALRTLYLTLRVLRL